MGFDDRTMMYEGDAKDWEAQVNWHGDQLRRLIETELAEVQNPIAPAVKREVKGGIAHYRHTWVASGVIRLDP